VLQGLGMNVDPNKPLVAVISRLVPQVRSFFLTW
jgi:hypothetical protein